MIKIKKYNPNDTYMLGNGEVGHEAVVKHFPGVTHFPHLVETDEGGEIAYAIQLISAMRNFHDIDPELSEADALQAIEDKINAERNAQPELTYTDETRIADALEDLVVLQMPDIEGV